MWLMWMWAVGDVDVSHDALGTSMWLASMPLGVDVVHIDVADMDVGGGRRRRIA